MASPPQDSLHWSQVLRLGVVQACIGSIAVLMVSTLNRVMVVEYALPAAVPASLVALHYFVQLFRPRVGFLADSGARLSHTIIAGAALFSVASVLCAASTLGLAHAQLWGVLLAIAGYVLVGLGIGIAGTALLVLMTRRVDPRQRGSAAAIMWIMMIAGFALTAGISSHFLDPYSPQRLITVTAIAAVLSLLITCGAVWDADAWGGGSSTAAAVADRRHRMVAFKTSLRSVWSEPQSRNFALFVFISMLAYSAEELILEPFAGVVFHYSLGMSARLSGLLHAAAFVGMCGIAWTTSRARRIGSLRAWTLAGCLSSAAALLGLMVTSLFGIAESLQPLVLLLGFANGVFAVAAIGAMMESASSGGDGRAGIRLGVWGAAQAVAFALGGFVCASLLDALRSLAHRPETAFATVLAVESLLFVCAALCAVRGVVAIKSPAREEALIL